MGNTNYSKDHTGDKQFDSWYPWGRYMHHGKHVKEIFVNSLDGFFNSETDWHITYTDGSTKHGTCQDGFLSFDWWTHAFVAVNEFFFIGQQLTKSKFLYEKAEDEWGFVSVNRKNSGDGNTYISCMYTLVPKEKQQFDVVRWRKSQLRQGFKLANAQAGSIPVDIRELTLDFTE